MGLSPHGRLALSRRARLLLLARLEHHRRALLVGEGEACCRILALSPQRARLRGGGCLELGVLSLRLPLKERPAHGQLLSGACKELLLPLEEYLKLMAGNGPPLGRKERSAIRKDHAVRHPEAWLELLFQAVKVFVLGRVTPRAFKALPGMGDSANGEGSDSGSNGINAGSGSDHGDHSAPEDDAKEPYKRYFFSLFPCAQSPPPRAPGISPQPSPVSPRAPSSGAFE